jgi:hypothetical protein
MNETNVVDAACIVLATAASIVGIAYIVGIFCSL